MWERCTETNKTNQSTQDLFTSPHLGIFRLYFPILLWSLLLWEAYDVQKCFKGDLFWFRPDIKVLRFWGTDPGRSMGGGRGISNMVPLLFPSVSLRSSSFGRKTEKKLKTLGEAVILIPTVATVGELRRKWELVLTVVLPDDRKLLSCLDARSTCGLVAQRAWLWTPGAVWASTSFTLPG